MSMVIKNNLPGLRSQNTTSKNSKALSKSLAKVASGMRINSAADDASGYAISERMRTQIRSLDQANANSQNARSLLRVADGALSSSVEIMRFMKEKAINAANDTNTDEDRAIIQKELDQQIDQINDNANVTFNGKYLFDRTADLSDNVEQTIAAALYSEWIPNSLELINNTMGLSFSGSSGCKEIGVYFANEGGNTLAYVTNWSDSDGKVKELALTVNMDFYNTLVEGDVNGASTASGALYLDRTIAHELTHAVMGSNIEGFSKLYACIKEGAAEAVHGIDDARKTTIQTLADSKSIASKLTTDSKAAGTDTYAAGFVMFRYMAAHSGGYSADESMSRFMSTLAAGSGNMTTARIDEAVAAATKGRFKTFDDMKTALAADEAAAASGTEFLEKYCHINLKNNQIDVGSITGSDAGSRYDKNAEGAVWEAGSTKFWTNPLAKETIIDGLNVKWQAGNRDVKMSDGNIRHWRSADIKISGGLVFQTGTRAGQNLRVAMGGADAQALGLMDKNGKTLKVTTQVKAEQAIYQMDRSIERALAQLTTIGAISNRLEYTSANLVTASENVTAAESVIRDADMAKEMTEYTKNNILLQASQSMLAQANQSSSGVLSLLQ